jgi:S1/P1 Nuclease
MKNLVPLAALCLAVSFAPAAFGWNGFGHMMVAAVAYDELTPAAHAKVTRLLQLNPDYPRWISRANGAERDKIAFVMAATWADAIKSERGYQNDGERPSGPDASRNVGYGDRLQHRYWHYIDIPFSPDHTPLVRPATPNAETQIGVFRKTLSSPEASDALKSYDLVWLLHLVGDVHQPLHATSRFTRMQPTGDAGGNLVALCERPCRNELHAFWDDLPGTGKNPAVAIRRANRLPRPDARVAAIDDESRWMQESFAIAQNSVYIRPIGIGSGPFSIDGPYRSVAHRVAGQRLALAGARLAHVLNEALR